LTAIDDVQIRQVVDSPECASGAVDSRQSTVNSSELTAIDDVQIRQVVDSPESRAIDGVRIRQLENCRLSTVDCRLASRLRRFMASHARP
jgi:hypothetical protein